MLSLPEPERSLFSIDEDVEVIRYRHHLGVWRAWSRVKSGPDSSAQDKARARTTFQDAAVRHWNSALHLWSDGQVQVALYLCEYAVECRLKVLLCDKHGVGSLKRAQYEAEKAEGRELDIMGSRGHDLPLLLGLSGLQGMKGDPEFHEAWAGYVTHWDVSWRYEVPEVVRKSAGQYYDSFCRVWNVLEGLS